MDNRSFSGRFPNLQQSWERKMTGDHAHYPALDAVGGMAILMVFLARFNPKVRYSVSR